MLTTGSYDSFTIFKIEDRTHLNAFFLVLLLLQLQCQLNENLLQLLVTVVDAELLKAAGKQYKQEAGSYRE